MRKILFVCTGNLFRSVAAEYSFNKIITSEKEVIASSAGIIADEPKANPLIVDDLINDLKRISLDVDEHVPVKLTKEILEKSDLVIAMAENHKEHIEKNFNKNAVLFNKVCFGNDESVKDLVEVMPEWRDDLDKAKDYIESVIIYINDSMPKFIENMDKFLPKK